jgi:hypothetical protein
MLRWQVSSQMNCHDFGAKTTVAYAEPSSLNAFAAWGIE